MGLFDFVAKQFIDVIHWTEPEDGIHLVTGPCVLIEYRNRGSKRWRRLKSDRFFTTDYTATVYTPEGMRWIDDNTMSTVLLRHCPELQPYLAKVENAFAPWPHAPGR